MYDIIFISYNEPNAEENFVNLYERFNSVGLFGERIKRVKNVKGIHNAHKKAASIANTDYFFVVDGDAVIVDDFNFDYRTKDKDTVHVYRCMNPINDLVYGYGGVKLFPTWLAQNMDTNTNDMTTSISKNSYDSTNQIQEPNTGGKSPDLKSPDLLSDTLSDKDEERSLFEKIESTKVSAPISLSSGKIAPKKKTEQG